MKEDNKLIKSTTKMAYKLSVMWLVVVVIFGVCMVQSVEGRREELFYSTSFLDNSYFRNMYRSLRNMASRFIGETGTRTKGTFLQDEEDKFPCDLKNMRSPEVPTSVHKLRPGKKLFLNSHIVFRYKNL